ncbi:common central domain of tyrosinase-domain-containing protein [Lasiosphaeria miniovina]|uniref:tyrosinase n=1 Tax=Lasiosphaeria miniovina TaxID=1954250 RepID=A0AA40BHX9_9PEZI|nr:common central domain of tyrosinase-domain-containing protein [Lasiosphaeria miniovina]KAK0734565.1 common central domain of tyrosinase-domain-containing protein [Lasiosphaeria miniovina]
MSANIAITGVPTTPGSNGSVPLRREIRELQQTFPDQFNLYILGLQGLQGLDESQLTSYYQIAGIHGMPFKPWDGVGSDSDWEESSGFGGYCTHSSILFTTWHRPYIALYEQSLYKSVQAVAAKFPAGALRDRYVAAAKDFRAPYFDWASQPPAGTSAFPSVLSSSTIRVVDVDGKTKSVGNPLYQFNFHPVNPSRGDFSSQWSKYPTTVRYPNRVTGQSQDARIAPILSNELASLRSNVGLLLLSYKNFDAFSFNQWDTSTSPGEYGSLEDVHNEIHDRVGGGGHMSSLEVSAFDPFFWLHHINVDRLWAIWQDLNPSSFMSPRPAPYSTFGVTQGATQDENTALTPFWDKTGRAFWTSAQIKDTASTFGYAYAETQKWQYTTGAAYQAALRQAVTKLYGTNVFANFVAHVTQRRTEDVHAPAVNVAEIAPSASASPSPPAASEPETPGQAQKLLGPIPASLKHLAPNNKYTEWVVNVRAEKHGLGQPFRVLVFLGTFAADPDAWDGEFNCVGRVSVLGRNDTTTQCARCRADGAARLMVSGTVPLTSALLQDIAEGELADLTPASVVPHLQRQLQWRVALFSGDEQQAADVPGLKVSVASTEVTIGADDGLPVYSGHYAVYPEITAGKPAGLREGEQA